MDEIAALRTLVERLAARIGGWTAITDPNPEIEVLLTAFPDDLPIGIPLPDGAAIIGTIRLTRSEPQPMQQIHVLFDMPAPAAQIHTFYQDQLPRAGWTIQESRSHFGGFTPPSTTISFETTMVQGQSGAHLTVNIEPTDTGVTQVELVIALYPPDSPWIAARAMRSLHHNLEHGFLPPLRLPPGTTFIAGGGGSRGSSANVESDMTVETDLDRASMVAYITPQLEQAGWTQRDAGDDGALAWSAWAFADKSGAPWRGVLYVLQCPDQQRRYRLSLWGEWSGQRV